MQPGIGRIREVFDYEKLGGSPLLGVKGTVLITHGRAKRRMIGYAVARRRAAARAGPGARSPMRCARSRAPARRRCRRTLRSTTPVADARRARTCRCRGLVVTGPRLAVGAGASSRRWSAWPRWRCPACCASAAAGRAWRRWLGGRAVRRPDRDGGVSTCRLAIIARPASRWCR